MTQRIRLDDGTYEVGALPPEGKALVERLSFVQGRLQELGNQMAVLNKAKNGYVADLKGEIVKGRTGIDLAGLFSDD